MAASAGQPFNINTAATQGIQGAMLGTAGGLGYNSAAGAQMYANPFQNQVIQGLQNDAQRGMNMVSNQLGAAATRAGAFGGSRHGIAEGQALGDIQSQLNNQVGNLRYQGYQNAMNQSLQDQQMRLQAASQLGNLSNLGFGMGQEANKQLMQQGYMQQMLNQQLMDKAAAQYAGMQDAPYKALNTAITALGGTPYSTSSTSSSDIERGLMDYLMMGAMFA